MSSKALRAGLMGAAGGLMQGMLANWQNAQEEARTERLRRAREAERVSLMQLQNRITPPQQRTVNGVDEQGNPIQTTQQWDVDMSSNDPSQWSGQYNDVSTSQLPREAPKSRTIKRGDDFVLQEFDPMSGEWSDTGDTAPRYKSAPEGSGGSSPRSKQVMVKNLETGEISMMTLGNGESLPPNVIPITASNATTSGKTDKEWTSAYRAARKDLRDMGSDEFGSLAAEYDIPTDIKNRAEGEKLIAEAMANEETGGKSGGLMGSAPKAEKPAEPDPQQAPEKPKTPERRGTKQDADELVAAADRAIAAGKDPDAVQRILAAEMAKIGYTMGVE